MGGSIGETNIVAIADTYRVSRQTPRVPRTPTRTVWIRVKEALGEAGLPDTQVFVARQLKMAQASVALWNRPGGYPTLENAISLAKLLNVNVEWLLTERGPKRPIPQDASAQRLWDLWARLDDVTKGELIGMALGRLQRSRAESEEAYTPARSSLAP